MKCLLGIAHLIKHWMKLQRRSIKEKYLQKINNTDKEEQDTGAVDAQDKREKICVEKALEEKC